MASFPNQVSPDCTCPCPGSTGTSPTAKITQADEAGLCRAAGRRLEAATVDLTLRGRRAALRRCLGLAHCRDGVWIKAACRRLPVTRTWSSELPRRADSFAAARHPPFACSRRRPRSAAMLPPAPTLGREAGKHRGSREHEGRPPQLRFRTAHVSCRHRQIETATGQDSRGSTGQRLLWHSETEEKSRTRRNLAPCLFPTQGVPVRIPWLKRAKHPVQLRCTRGTTVSSPRSGPEPSGLLQLRPGTWAPLQPRRTRRHQLLLAHSEDQRPGGLRPCADTGLPRQLLILPGRPVSGQTWQPCPRRGVAACAKVNR